MLIEKEIKIILTNEQYEYLMNTFDWEPVFEQINHYYGSNIYSDSNITIRIRENNGYKLQVKIPKSIEGSLHIKEEYEIKVDGICSKINRKTLQNLTGYSFDEDKELLGELITKRRICNAYKDIQIALDENDYLEIKDYEIEIEYINEYPKVIIEKLKALDIDISKEVKGKHSRFIERLKLIK